MGKCKGCGREIIWIMTRSGKAMPCDPEPVPCWKVSKEMSNAKEKLVLGNGDVISCSLEKIPGINVSFGYVPHWSTCPAAGQFKRK